MRRLPLRRSLLPAGILNLISNFCFFMKIIFKKKLYNFFATVFFAVLFLNAGTAEAGTLSCAVTTNAACSAASGVVIYKMSSATNAHAGVPSWGTAIYNNNVVCCTGVTGLSNVCSGTYATALYLKAAGGNSHVSQTTTATYTTSVCLQVPSGGSVSVGYAANCSGYDTTLGSMRGTTNSHAGDGAWTNGAVKICATASSSGTVQATGFVISSTFDTWDGVRFKGAAYNYLMWKGTSGSGSVRLQLATSDCSNGKTNFPNCNDAGNWSFKGQDCNTSTYYETASGTPIEVMCADHNNKQYFRYKVILCSSGDCSTPGATSPQVEDVVVNWSP